VQMRADRLPTMAETRDRAAWFEPGRGTVNGRVRWNLPRGDRSTKAPEWSAADAGHAAGGMPVLWWSAFLYHWAGDTSGHVYRRLWWRLIEYGGQYRERNGLPAKLPRCSGPPAEYLPQLARMWLAEARRPSDFVRSDSREPGRWRVYMDVPKHVWLRKMAAIYEAMGAEYLGWLGSAHAWMAPRLRETDRL
jgi:hypothetical protein